MRIEIAKQNKMLPNTEFHSTTFALPKRKKIVLIVTCGPGIIVCKYAIARAAMVLRRRKEKTMPLE